MSRVKRGQQRSCVQAPERTAGVAAVPEAELTEGVLLQN